MKRFCSQCGEELAKSAKFCSSCGAVAGTADEASEPEKGHKEKASRKRTRPKEKRLQPAPATAPPEEQPSTAASAEAILRAARKLPWKQRPEQWWNTFSVAAGAGSGVLWLAYSSVRGLPRPAFLSQLFGSWTDLMPALGLLVLAWIKRRAIMSRIFRLQENLQKKTTGSRIMVMLGLLAVGFLAPRLISSLPFLRGGEGVDLVTPILMTLLPMALVMFRTETDRMLAPIQPFRRRVGPLIALGMSLAAPFATAHLLYHGLNFKMYPLMHANLPFGLIASYALARNPVVRSASPSLSSGNLSGWLLFLLLLPVFGMLAEPALADDFLRDPFNLNDGLRTGAFAPWLAGIPTAIVSMTVNGVEVIRVVIQGAKTEGADGKPAETASFQVVVRSADESGATATTLASGGLIRVLAHCEKEGRPFPAGNPTIRFAQQGAPDHVSMTDAGTLGPDRGVELRFVDPAPSDPAPEQMTVMVSAGKGGLISAPVTITLQAGEFELEFF